MGGAQSAETPARTTEPPLLSVVMGLDGQRTRGQSALGALLGQSIVDRMEILLLDVGHDVNAPIAGSDHPRVRVVRLPRGMSYGEALARGVAEAGAPIVAFVEEHVLVQPGWAEAIVLAHRGPWAAVCGEIIPGDLDRDVARHIELVSRNVWSAPAIRGESPVLRWQNTSYKRALLLAFGERLSLLFDSESTLFRELRRQGGALYVEPAARMVHAHENEWRGFLRGSFHSNRLSAAAAVEYLRPGKLGRLKRIAAALAGPVRWPLVLLQRSRSLPDRDVWVPLTYASALPVLQYYTVVAAANLVGLTLGRGESGRRFLEFELGVERRAPVAVDRTDRA